MFLQVVGLGAAKTAGLTAVRFLSCVHQAVATQGVTLSECSSTNFTIESRFLVNSLVQLQFGFCREFHVTFTAVEVPNVGMNLCNVIFKFSFKIVLFTTGVTTVFPFHMKLSNMLSQQRFSLEYGITIFAHE